MFLDVQKQAFWLIKANLTPFLFAKQRKNTQKYLSLSLVCLKNYRGKYPRTNKICQKPHHEKPSFEQFFTRVKSDKAA